MGKTKFEQEEEVSNYTNSEFVVSSAPNHHSRRLKKDALREKKMNKALQKKTAASEEHQTDNLSTKHKSDQDHSITSPDNTHKNPGVTPSIGIDNLSYPLAGLLNKPTYVSINQKNKISGNYGHGTAYFKRPLIQGNYFLEYTVRQDTKKQKKVKYDSAIRVGICEVDFNPAFPLGCKQSVAYKSADGTIIYQNEKIGTAQPYKVGDTIAICLKLGPLQKFRDPKAKSEGSSLQFYKNGKLVFQFKQLKQVFYCLGVSFFNYSQIQILKKEECSYIEGAVQYFKCLKEKIPYKDLQHNNMFKI